MLAVLGVVVAIGVNAVGNRSHPVGVPDVGGQTQQDAIATLQSHGFKIRGPVQQPDPSVPIGYVISTDPGPDTALAGGDEITVTGVVRTRPASGAELCEPARQRLRRRLADAGFDQPKPMPASATTPQNLVVATDPPAGQISAVTNAITIHVSSGPEARRVPDVSGQSVAQATANLKAAGFQIILDRTCGQ